MCFNAIVMFFEKMTVIGRKFSNYVVESVKNSGRPELQIFDKDLILLAFE